MSVCRGHELANALKGEINLELFIKCRMNFRRSWSAYAWAKLVGSMGYLTKRATLHQKNVWPPHLFSPVLEGLPTR